MKGLDMDIKWRTVQFFMSLEGISEVEVDADNPQKVRCSCTQFNNSGRCKHSKFIKKQMDENDGHYNIQIPANVTDEEAIAAIGSPEAFRSFILKYAKVEVID
jgi:hypothetical protein